MFRNSFAQNFPFTRLAFALVLCFAFINAQEEIASMISRPRAVEGHELTFDEPLTFVLDNHLGDGKSVEVTLAAGKLERTDVPGSLRAGKVAAEDSITVNFFGEVKRGEVVFPVQLRHSGALATDEAAKSFSEAVVDDLMRKLTVYGLPASESAEEDVEKVQDGSRTEKVLSRRLRDDYAAVRASNRRRYLLLLGGYLSDSVEKRAREVTKLVAAAIREKEEREYLANFCGISCLDARRQAEDDALAAAKAEDTLARAEAGVEAGDEEHGTVGPREAAVQLKVTAARDADAIAAFERHKKEYEENSPPGVIMPEPLTYTKEEYEKFQVEEGAATAHLRDTGEPGTSQATFHSDYPEDGTEDVSYRS